VSNLIELPKIPTFATASEAFLTLRGMQKGQTLKFKFEKYAELSQFYEEVSGNHIFEATLFLKNHSVVEVKKLESTKGGLNYETH
jgi:hypothetical protein